MTDSKDISVVSTVNMPTPTDLVTATTIATNNTPDTTEDTEKLEKILTALSNLTINGSTLQLAGQSNLALPLELVIILAMLYIVTILAALVGNVLVVLAVVRSSKLRTASNAYLVNLAVSDILLVTLASPATLTQLVTKHWPLGTGVLSGIICFLIGFQPMLFGLLSAFTIACIALDRHRIILHSANARHQRLRMVIALLICWGLAAFLAFPAANNLKTHRIGPFSRSYCLELSWTYSSGRLYYSLVVLAAQLLLPTVIMSLAHLSIYRKLASLPLRQQQLQRRQQRGDRTQRLLVCVVLVFTCSWLPLHLCIVLKDLGFNFWNSLNSDDYRYENAVNAAVHLIGMSSSVSNPILYGYFNQGFRQEFASLLCRRTNETSKGQLTRGQLTEDGTNRQPLQEPNREECQNL